MRRLKGYSLFCSFPLCPAKGAWNLLFPLDLLFYEQDTITVARTLLGKILWRETNDGPVSGMIVETEAYLSSNDPACHASRGRTKRNAVMFGPPGRAYVYLIYGLYCCFNVVTGPAGLGEAVLVRAVEPLSGLDFMRGQRGRDFPVNNLAAGPGRLCRAFAVDRSYNGHDLRKSPLYITGGDTPEPPSRIRSTRRIGVASGAEIMLRFIVSGSSFLSRRETNG